MAIRSAALYINTDSHISKGDLDLTTLSYLSLVLKIRHYLTSIDQSERGRQEKYSVRLAYARSFFLLFQHVLRDDVLALSALLHFALEPFIYHIRTEAFLLLYLSLH